MALNNGLIQQIAFTLQESYNEETQFYLVDLLYIFTDLSE
jgi:hypothetical protein